MDYGECEGASSPDYDATATYNATNVTTGSPCAATSAVVLIAPCPACNVQSAFLWNYNWHQAGSYEYTPEYTATKIPRTAATISVSWSPPIPSTYPSSLASGGTPNVVMNPQWPSVAYTFTPLLADEAAAGTASGSLPAGTACVIGNQGGNWCPNSSLSFPVGADQVSASTEIGGTPALRLTFVIPAPGGGTTTVTCTQVISELPPFAQFTVWQTTLGVGYRSLMVKAYLPFPQATYFRRYIRPNLAASKAAPPTRAPSTSG